MANEMFTHYDKPRIAMLCEKAGLFQRALEHYENTEDLKRVMSRTDMIQPEFLVKCASKEPISPLAAVPHLSLLIPRDISYPPHFHFQMLLRFFGLQPAETGIEMLHHMLRTNMRQNLQVVVQVAREYSEQLTPEKLIEMFETYNSWEVRRLLLPGFWVAI